MTHSVLTLSIASTSEICPWLSVLFHSPPLSHPHPRPGKALGGGLYHPCSPTYHCSSMYMPTSIVSQYLTLSNVITMIRFSSLILPWSYQLSGNLLIHCGKASLIIQSHVVGYLGCSWRLWNSLQEFSPPQQVGHSDPPYSKCIQKA